MNCNQPHHIALASILAFFTLITSELAMAAKPVKITPGAKMTDASGAPYRVYKVKCSNGKATPISSWKKGKQWCLGEGVKDTCAKKQIKAAKKACKIA